MQNFFLGCKIFYRLQILLHDCKNFYRLQFLVAKFFVGCKFFFCCTIAKIFFWLQFLVAKLVAKFFGCHVGCLVKILRPFATKKVFAIMCNHKKNGIICNRTFATKKVLQSFVCKKKVLRNKKKISACNKICNQQKILQFRDNSQQKKIYIVEKCQIH